MDFSLKIKFLMIAGIVVGGTIGISAFVILLDNPQGTTIRIGALSGDLHHLPLFVAIEEDFFLEEGISINLQSINWFPNGNEVMVAFEAGSLDIAYLGLAPAMAHKLTQNAPIKVISGVNVNGSAIIVGGTSGINSLSDLAGKKIAVPSLNNMQDFILQIALDSVGLEFTDLGSHITLSVGNMENALNIVQIDGFIAWEPFNAKAIDNIGAKSLKNSSEIWANHPCCIIAASDNFIQTQHTSISSIIKVHKKALEWMANGSNYDQLITIAKKYTSITSDNAIKMGIENVGYIYNYTKFMPEIERFYDNLTNLNNNVPAWSSGRTAFFQEFLDTSFLSA